MSKYFEVFLWPALIFWFDPDPNHPEVLDRDPDQVPKYNRIQANCFTEPTPTHAI